MLRSQAECLWLAPSSDRTKAWERGPRLSRCTWTLLFSLLKHGAGPCLAEPCEGWGQRGGLGCLGGRTGCSHPEGQPGSRLRAAGCRSASGALLQAGVSPTQGQTQCCCPSSPAARVSCELSLWAAWFTLARGEPALLRAWSCQVKLTQLCAIVTGRHRRGGKGGSLCCAPAPCPSRAWGCRCLGEGTCNPETLPASWCVQTGQAVSNTAAKKEGLRPGQTGLGVPKPSVLPLLCAAPLSRALLSD